MWSISVLEITKNTCVHAVHIRIGFTHNSSAINKERRIKNNLSGRLGSKNLYRSSISPAQGA